MKVFRWPLFTALFLTVDVLLFLIPLAWGGWQFTALGFNQLTPGGIAQWISFAAIPAGSALGLVHLAAHAWDVAANVDLDNGAHRGHGHTETRTQ